MIPVFKRINGLDGELSLEKLAAHINEMQEEIENCLMDISSDNIKNISSDLTTISSKLGSKISGNEIALKGKSVGVLYIDCVDPTDKIIRFTGADGAGFEFKYDDKEGAVTFTVSGEEKSVTINTKEAPYIRIDGVNSDDVLLRAVSSDGKNGFEIIGGGADFELRPIDKGSKNTMSYSNFDKLWREVF